MEFIVTQADLWTKNSIPLQVDPGSNNSNSSDLLKIIYLCDLILFRRVDTSYAWPCARWHGRNEQKTIRPSGMGERNEQKNSCPSGTLGSLKCDVTSRFSISFSEGGGDFGWRELHNGGRGGGVVMQNDVIFVAF